MAQSKIAGPEFENLIQTHMSVGFDFRVTDLALGRATLRLSQDRQHLRPGGTISGPTLFTLADTALYAAVLSSIGLVPLAVTTDMTIHFLRRPAPTALIAVARVLKLGKKLVYGDVEIFSEGEADPVCHANGTYARPPG